MPTIAEFDGIRILMYYRDHDPPDCHVEFGDTEAIVRIVDLVPIESHVPPQVLDRALRWAESRQAALALDWIRCRAHVAPDRL